MSEETVFHRRLFLNDKEGAAMVEAKLANHSYDRNGERAASYDGTLHLTDCNRSIDLSFDFYSKEDARMAIRKLDRLIETVEDLRTAVKRAAKKEFNLK